MLLLVSFNGKSRFDFHHRAYLSLYSLTSIGFDRKASPPHSRALCGSSVSLDRVRKRPGSRSGRL
jgi:hypothetical protein